MTQIMGGEDHKSKMESSSTKPAPQSEKPKNNDPLQQASENMWGFMGYPQRPGMMGCQPGMAQHPMGMGPMMFGPGGKPQWRKMRKMWRMMNKQRKHGGHCQVGSHHMPMFGPPRHGPPHMPPSGHMPPPPPPMFGPMGMHFGPWGIGSYGSCETNVPRVPPMPQANSEEDTTSSSSSESEDEDGTLKDVPMQMEGANGADDEIPTENIWCPPFMRPQVRKFMHRQCKRKFRQMKKEHKHGCHKHHAKMHGHPFFAGPAGNPSKPPQWMVVHMRRMANRRLQNMTSRMERITKRIEAVKRWEATMEKLENEYKHKAENEKKSCPEEKCEGATATETKEPEPLENWQQWQLFLQQIYADGKCSSTEENSDENPQDQEPGDKWLEWVFPKRAGRCHRRWQRRAFGKPEDWEFIRKPSNNQEGKFEANTTHDTKDN